jgi:hypothetical protein
MEITFYQIFLLPFVITSAFGYPSAVQIVVSELIDPVHGRSERWMILICWGYVVIWPTALVSLIVSFVI